MAPNINTPVTTDVRQDILKGSNTCEVHMLRHGETDWNLLLRLQGRTDTVLNEKGIKQGEAAASYFYPNEGECMGYAAVYSSPLLRAKQTAEIIAKAAGLSEVHIDEGLLEWNLGILEGKTATECQDQYPEEWAIWQSREHTGSLTITNGECGDEVIKRVTCTIENIAKKHVGEKILLVCHGGMLSQIKRHCLTPPQHVNEMLDVDMVRKTGNKNASLSIFHVGSQGSWLMEMWSDVSHLASEGLVGRSAY